MTESPLEAAVRRVLAQKFDDVCWLDVYRELGVLVGVPYTPELLPQAEFLANCKRFHESLARGCAYQTPQRPHLFQAGAFKLRSGKESTYKIECDAMTPADWEGVAAALVEEKMLEPFEAVEGVPRGGLPFADALRRYATPGCGTLLIAEDVVTTGGSIERYKMEQVRCWTWTKITGVCFLARGKVPAWITPFLRGPGA